jgi:cytochrome c-type biogenesis protein
MYADRAMDQLAGVGIPVAFGAGLISFLSPCVLPLVPGYLSSVAGVKDTAELTARRVIGPSLAFVGTFSAIYIALGLIGQQALRGTLTGATARQVCGAIIVVMGLVFVLSPLIPRIAREWHMQSLMERAGESGPVLTGVAFAIAWTPCQSPTLGAIISATGTSTSALKGALFLAVYCLGLGVPFLITGLAFGKATAAFKVIKRHYSIVIGVGGVILIGMGVLIWTDQFALLNQHVSNWLSAVGLPSIDSKS